MKLKLVILGLLFYTISYSQKRPESYDVVLGGKKEGLISLEILKKYKKTNIIYLDIIKKISNYTRSQKVLFNVDVLSDEGVRRKQIIKLIIK